MEEYGKSECKEVGTKIYYSYSTCMYVEKIYNVMHAENFFVEIKI